MQAKWKDLIPFYVAGTLTDPEKHELEAYLEQCGAPCQSEIEEWRTIASATWHYSNVDMQNLPPLSQTVLTQVAHDAPLRASGKVLPMNEIAEDNMTHSSQAPVYPRPAESSNKKIRPASRVPLTMVAAFMTVVIFGGILLSRISPDDFDPQSAVIQLTEVGTATVNATEQFGAQVGIAPDTPDNSGILATPTLLAPQSTATFAPSSTPLPTQRSTLPPNSGGGIVDTSSIAGLPTTGACTIRNDSLGRLTTYRNASFDAPTVGFMDAGSQAKINIVFDGWYQVSYGNWVFGGNVTVFGDCSQVWTATPTAIGDNWTATPDPSIPQCFVRNDSTEPVMLYQMADDTSPASGLFPTSEEVQIYVGTNNGWYQVYYQQWVKGSDVTVEGTGCNNLWIPTPTQSGFVTPIPTSAVPADGNPIAVVRTVNSIILGSPATTGMFVEQVPQGANLAVLAHNGVFGPQRWYLVRSQQARVGWVPSLDVDVIPNDIDVNIAATIPFIPSATPTRPGPTPMIEQWSHISTVIEHGCGDTVGDQSTIPVHIQHLGTEVILTYPETLTSFSLNSTTPNSYSGTYGRGATVQVDLTFTSGTSYTANETITHESGCIVRSTWAGTRQ